MEESTGQGVMGGPGTRPTCRGAVPSPAGRHLRVPAQARVELRSGLLSQCSLLSSVGTCPIQVLGDHRNMAGGGITSQRPCS